MCTETAPSGRTTRTARVGWALLDDRPALRARVAAAFDAAVALPEVDASRVAGIGFCFGGLCVLDLARSGADVKGVASFHGFFHNPEPELAARIGGRVLAFHGADDPLVPAAEIDLLHTEMTAAEVDWELVVYGGAAHGFMNPAANAPDRGVAWHPEAARRAQARLETYLADLFA
jgi:dienelactone hydrolase